MTLMRVPGPPRFDQEQLFLQNPASPVSNDSVFEGLLIQILTCETEGREKKYEFESYVDITDPIKETKSFDPITWWQFVAEDFPTFHLYALDTLSCPTISTECERAFSSAKKLLTPERNALSMDIIEACEC